MGSTKIFVLQMRELIKTGIFALIGLILIIALIWFLVPKGSKASPSAYIPGTYTAQIILHSKPVNVEVTVSKNEIISVEMKDMLKAQELSYPLFKPTIETLKKEVVRTQSTQIPVSTESAVTSKIILDAIDVALEQARDIETAEN